MATINALMRHLRENGVSISGSDQKRELRRIGYYHGYKGYRFAKKSSNRLPLRDFGEVVALHDFDMELKALFYSRLMIVETALKNRVLEAVLAHSGSDKFEDIFRLSLTAHRCCKKKDYKNAWRRRLQLRAEVDRIIANNHGSREVITHFHEQDRDVPIWALFEVMTLGNFGAFFMCLHDDVKDAVCADLGMPARSFDASAVLTKAIFALKDLRNAVAHNGVIVDVRFKDAAIDGSLGSLLKAETGTRQEIKFDEITDYLLLLVYLMAKLGSTKRECERFLDEFAVIIEKYRALLPYSIYCQFISTSARAKIDDGKKFVKRL